MATTSKIQFKLVELIAQATGALDEQISMKQQALDAIESHDDLQHAWRVRQEERIEAIYARIGDGDLTDHELASFQVEPMPRGDSARIQLLVELDALKTQRIKMMAKAASLVSDEKGIVTLTKLQLRELFDL